MKHMISGDAPVAFDTFDIVKATRPKGWGKYEFLKNMPNGAHFHFPGERTHKVREAISKMNMIFARQGSVIHFSCYAVGDSDPKGIGIRVIRKDRLKKRLGKP